MILGLLARARALVRPPVRVAHHAPEPLSSRLGATPFRVAGRGPVGPVPPPLWDQDPASGEPLPTGPALELAPDAYLDARVVHRHGWFASLAFAAARGADSAAAVDTMDGWLRQDIPGTGLAWAHGSDLAVRLVHWHAGLAWLGDHAPDWLRDRLAGSAAWHLEHLRDRTPDDPARAVVHHVGRVVGALTFPDIPGAAAHAAEGLSGLGRDLPRLVHADGAPVDDAPARLLEVLWLVAIARAVAFTNGAAFPSAAEAALVRGARCCERLAGALGTLPALGDAPLGDALACTDAPLAWSLWNLVVGWRLDVGGAPGADVDPRLAWLGVSPPEPATDALKTWSMWVFRESGLAVAWMPIKGRASRVVAEMGSPATPSPSTHIAPLNLLWTVGSTEVLADPGSATRGPRASWLRSPRSHNALLLDGHTLADVVPSELVVARVDGKKARIHGRHLGWQRFRVPLTHERDVLLNQTRLIVTDRLVATRARVGRHAVRLAWQLGPGWKLTRDDAGFTGKNGDLTLVIKLPTTMAWAVMEGDEAGWVWTDGGEVPAPCLVGEGGVDGAVELVSSFEIR